MVQRTGGFRRKTRAKLSKSPRQKGKISIRRYLDSFEPGSRVLLAAEPAIQYGMYHPRFHGKAGIVLGQQGECFVVSIRDGGKQKEIVIHPAHLRRA